jgi:Domain of unknown function (DUF932)
MNAFNRAFNMRNVSAIDNDALLKKAPSVFAESAHESTSSRYTQIPTIQIVEALRREGWMPVSASESRVRDDSKKGFAKHLLRFRHLDDIARTLNVKDNFSEIVLLNSHDGTSSYQLHAGVFRLVCSNGMIVADNVLEKQCVRHSGDILGNVVEGVYSIVEDLPAVHSRIDHYKGIALNTEEQHVLASAGMALRWDENAPVTPEKVVKANRHEDRPNDLWTVFNRVQENLLRGGLSGYTRDPMGHIRRTTTREVKSVNENVRLNKALWMLADEMARLKA